MTLKLRKTLCAAFAAALCVMLAGCSSDSAGTASSTSNSSTVSSSSASTSDTMPAPANTDTSDSMDNAGNGDNNNNDGEYNVPENGMVPDDTDDNNKDEAAFASSYMDIAANGLSITKIGWGLGGERDEENRPIDAVKAQEKYAALNAKFLTGDKRICLTFDEGYENGYTESILDTLKEKGVKAIFFVTYDYCRRSPELVKRMIEEGHTVGNHTYTHPSMPDCSAREMTEEVNVLHNYVLEQFGYEMELFRFPKGEFSENALDIVNGLGYTSVFWSFAYNDWDTSAQPDPAASLKKIKDSTHSGIYLLHAVSPTNAQILGEVIDYWTGQGYEVGTRID